MKALLPALLGLSLPAAAFAQASDPHAGHNMHDMTGRAGMEGMDMSQSQPRAPVADTGASDPHAGHAMHAQPADTQATGTDQAPGSAEAPAMTHDRQADRYWNPVEMAAAERVAMRSPVATYYQVIVDLAEYQIRDGHDGYRWEGQAWMGDADRFMIKSEGEGTFGEGVEHAEVQALYSKALDPWWNLQAGVRQDIRPTPARTWATVGLEGRARYQFEAGAWAFLSDKGQFTGRIEGAYDQRITQRLVLQPRVELNLSAQDMPEQRIGSGLSSTELGLRLRYEIRREFAPYVGVSWTWLSGKTADYARADGHDPGEGSLVAGVRVWF